MNVLIVGGDYVANIQKYMNEQGHVVVDHWVARKRSDCHKKLPIQTDLVLVLTDYVNHGMLYNVKTTAKTHGLPVVFSKNSVSALKKVLH